MGDDRDRVGPTHRCSGTRRQGWALALVVPPGRNPGVIGGFVNAGAISRVHPPLNKAQAKLDDLATTLARARTRRTTAQLTTAITTITADSWVRSARPTSRTGRRRSRHSPKHPHHRSKRPHPHGSRTRAASASRSPITITGRSPMSWPPTAPQSEIEAGFGQLKDPHIVPYHKTHSSTATMPPRSELSRKLPLGLPS